MQIVINVFEETYKSIKHGMRFKDDVEAIMTQIENSRPLSNAHGRLIILSEDAVKREQQMPLSFSHQKWISEVGLSNATVAIIDADEEE